MRSDHDKAVTELVKIDKDLIKKDPKYLKKLISQKEKQMDGAVKILDFESAALLRDEILELSKMLPSK